MRTRKAFSLIELIVGMAIVAVLITLGIVGIGIVQQNSRDVERNNTISTITNMINDYRKQYLSVPKASDVLFSNSQVSITGFKNFALKGFLSPAGSTSQGGTRYYYNNVNNSLAPSNSDYMLCVQLESGSVKGSGTTQCTPVTSWN